MKILILQIFLAVLCRNVLCNPSCPSLEPSMLNVHLICHTHDDVGWLKTVDQYYYGSNKGFGTDGVQYILDSVVESLLRDPNRKFIYVESAFFYRWWSEQDDQMKNDVITLVNNGQLEFINGGWCMNDEASAHYNDIIDQMTLGLTKINETFGPAAFPRVGWQLDPFGHSSEQASLFAQMGMDGMFFGRLDHDDKNNRWNTKQMEIVWKASNNLGDDASLFTGILPNTYFPPGGFCFDVFCGDDPIMDDPKLDDYNKDEMVDRFIQEVNNEAPGYLSTNNIVMTMGSDFQYLVSETWFKNLDKLIKYVNERQSTGSNINVVYSTPSCYLDALHSENLTWPTKTDDFFPYASDPHAYWTGYFTSRPTLKGFVRSSNNLLQSLKQIAALAGLARDPSLTTLAEALGVLQHHDGVSGTAKQHVTDDYSKRLARGAAAAVPLIDAAFSVLTNQAQQESFAYCPQLNISACPFTEYNLRFVVNVYNPLGRTRSHYVRVPMAVPSTYTVTDQQGNILPYELVPLPAPILNLPGRDSIAIYDLVFYAQDLPPLGVTQYLVEDIVKLSDSKSDFPNPKSDRAEHFTIEKGNIKVSLDAATNKIKSVGLPSSDGFQDLDVSQDWMWYEGMAGDNSNFDQRASGAYIFRPNGAARQLSNVTTITGEFNGTLVHEVHQEWTSWVTQVVRSYADKSYVEIEWLVGPIPIGDGLGKEIVNRIDWGNMLTNSTFYTDANGREMQRRVRDYRETWNLDTTTEPESRNYYPVTSRLILQSINGQGNAAVMNDRAQGGTSLTDGQTELMVHRRLLYDDAFGVGEALNERAFSEGLVVRGRHILIHSNMSVTGCDFGCLHRTVGEELLLQPLLTFSATSTFNISGSNQNPGLLAPLPVNLRVLTLEPWTNPGTWLLRLENFFEANESSQSGSVDFDIEDIFTDWAVTDIQETTLGANAYKGDIVRLQWNTLPDGSMERSQEPEPSKGKAAVYTFSPMQIRTFILTVVHK